MLPELTLAFLTFLNTNKDINIKYIEPIKDKINHEIFYTKTKNKKIKVSERVKNYNEKYDLNLSSEDYVCLVLIDYTENKGGYNSVLNRVGLGSIHPKFQNLYAMKDKEITILNALKGRKQYSPMINGGLEEQIKIVLEKDDFMPFLMHGNHSLREKYKGNYYTDFLKKHSKQKKYKNKNIKDTRTIYEYVDSLRNTTMLRERKLFRSIRAIESDTHKLINDLDYDDYTTNFKHLTLATDTTWTDGSEVKPGVFLVATDTLKSINTAFYTIRGRDVDFVKVRLALQEKYKPKNNVTELKQKTKEYFKNIVNSNRLNYTKD